MEREIKLMTDYYCYPLWGVDDDYGNIDPAELPINDELRRDLLRWAKAYDDTLNIADPLASPALSTEFKRHLHEEGLRLQAELQKQLGGDYYIYYQSPFPNPER